VCHDDVDLERRRSIPPVGAVGPWVDIGTERYFANLRIVRGGASATAARTLTGSMHRGCRPGGRSTVTQPLQYTAGVQADNGIFSAQ